MTAMESMTAMHEVADRRRERQITTRRAIEAAAWKLARVKGIQATTVNEIAAETGISPSTFFRYFDTKEAALYGNWRWQVDDLAKWIEKADPALSPLEAIHFAVVNLSHTLEQQREAVMRANEVFESSDRARNYYYQVIRPTLEQSAVRMLAAKFGMDPASDPTPRMLAGVAFSALTAAINVWIAREHSLLPMLTEQAFDAIKCETSPGSSRPRSGNHAAARAVP